MKSRKLTKSTKTAAPRIKPEPAKRSTETEMQLRHVEVASYLLSRSNYSEICRYVSVKWGSSQGVDAPQLITITDADARMADRYIAAAKTLIAERIAAHKNATIDEHIDALFDLVRRTRGAGDLRLELDIRKDVAKLLDLYPDPRIKMIDWRSEIIALLKSGAITPEQVREEMGDSDDINQILVAAGANPIQARPPEAASQPEPKPEP